MNGHRDEVAMLTCSHCGNSKVSGGRGRGEGPRSEGEAGSGWL